MNRQLPDKTDIVCTTHENKRVIRITGVSESARARFTAKVAVGHPDECWPWQAGTISPGSYGRFGFDRRTVLAHRFAYVVAYGEIPAGFDVLHRCDNPPCCNARHLFLGTHQDNMADRDAKGRGNAPCGEQNGKARLTAASAAAIRAEYRRGETPLRSFAGKYGVNWTTVRDVINGRTWKEVNSTERI